MESTLFKDGLIVMVIGMGTVFMFLVLMVYIMELNTKLLKFINKYFPEEIPEVKTAKKKVAGNKDKIAAAIALAVQNSKKV